MEIPELITERFTLRALRKEDAAELTEASREEHIKRFTVVPLDYTPKDALDFINYSAKAAAAGTELIWAIDYSGAYAGNIALRLPEGNTAGPGTVGEIGYSTAAPFRGRGIMTEAVRMVLGFAFDPLGLGLDEISWGCDACNTASERVARKAGFTNIRTVAGGHEGRDENFNAVTIDKLTATITRAQFAALGT